MTEPHVEISVFTLAPSEPSARGAERPALPAMFSGYRACEKDLVVTATLAEAVVGTGVAWLFEHDTEPPLMWARAVDVDEPFLGTGLHRSLIDALLHTGKQMGMTRAYIEPALREHLAKGT